MISCDFLGASALRQRFEPISRPFCSPNVRLERRRQAQYVSPIPKAKKLRAEQGELAIEKAIGQATASADQDVTSGGRC
jgi:hypothetical protein